MRFNIPSLLKFLASLMAVIITFAMPLKTAATSNDVDDDDLAMSSESTSEPKLVLNSEQRLEQRLEQNLPWWKEFLANPESQNTDLDKKMAAADKETLKLMWKTAFLKSNRYIKSFSQLSKKEREDLKTAVANYSEALSLTDLDSDRVNLLMQRIVDKDELVQKSKYVRFWMPTISFSTFADEYKFGGNLTGRGNSQIYTFGINYGRQNGFREMSIGAYVGQGTTNLIINQTSEFVAQAKTFVVGITGKYVAKLSESGSGLGAEFQIMTPTVTGTGSYSQLQQRVTAFVPLAIGRLAFSKIVFDIKGGKLLGRPTGSIWILELGYLF